MRKRIARLNEQLKRELSELIRHEVRDPRVGLVTITGVDVAADLGSARVFVRAVDDDALPRMLEGLEAAAPFLRTRLGQILHVRKVPELRFREDRSLEGARRIEALLSEVMPEGADDAGQKGEDADEAGPDGDEPGGDGGVRDGGARDGRARDGAGAGQSEDHDPVDEDA